MKEYANLVVVIPVAPDCREGFVLGTIESVCRYTTPCRRIVLADDSRCGLGHQLQAKVPDLDVVAIEEPVGSFGGLYTTLARTYAYVLGTYRFDALLRLDTDALIIGANPEDDALRLFREHPEIGIAGQYPYDYDGTPADFSWARGQILKQSRSLRTWVRRPAAVSALRRLYRQAAANGYEAGENVFGGAYFLTEECLRRLDKAGLLPDERLASLYLPEDHLFGLLVKAIGMDFGDLGSGDGPFACAGSALPDDPKRLLARGKKIIHSTHHWGDMKERDIRLFFQRSGTLPRGQERAGDRARAS